MYFTKAPTAIAVAIIAAGIPAVAHAARDIKDIIFQLVSILETTVPIIIGLAILYFFWGLALFIMRSDSEEERKKGKTIMIWGTVAIFIMFSVFGIIQVLLNTFFASFSSAQQFGGIHPFGGVNDNTAPIIRDSRLFQGADPTEFSGQGEESSFSFPGE